AEGPDWPQVWALAWSHLLGDGFVSFHIVLMPALSAALSFSKAEAGLALAVFNVVSCIGQPVLGHVCDLASRKALLLGGLLATVAGASCLGLAGSYMAVVLLLMGPAVGLCCYHPAGVSLAASAAGGRKGTVLSIYTSIGNFGVMLGPALLGLVVGRWGLHATVWAIPVGFVCVAPVLFLVRETGPSRRAGAERLREPTRKGAFVLLVAHMTARNVAIAGFATYLSFYALHELGMDLKHAGLVVSVFLFFGSLGALVGGHLSDYMPRKPILVASTLLSVAPLLGFLRTSGWVSTALLVVGALLLWAGHSVNVVLGQEYLPRNQSLASGITLGVTWGLASLLLPVWGRIADVHGERMALTVLAVSAPALTSVLAAFLPHTEKKPAAGGAA
ncbi:MAG TPA: MFS transporter, partial [Candidatus Brocadiia bacterium]|nr:MFS transporter [Candidatus Brocadiia bacterium]